MSETDATREQWLRAAVQELQPLFKAAGREIPLVQVSTPRLELLEKINL